MPSSLGLSSPRYLTMYVKVVWSFTTSVTTHKSTCCNIPEDLNLPKVMCGAIFLFFCGIYLELESSDALNMWKNQFFEWC